MQKIKTGIIGTGFIAEAHVEAIRRIGYAEVVAVSGSSEKKAKAFAEKHHIPYFYGDHKELLKGDIQVVHNCTPNHLHHSINKDIIESGKHILSEKPLTLTSRESKELVELVQKYGVVHGVNFNYRQYPLVQHLKKSIEKNELGYVHLVHGSYLQDWMLLETDFNWRADSGSGGKLRAVGDIGSHWIDLVQYILNQKVVEVFADLNTLYKTRKSFESPIETFRNKKQFYEDGKEISIDTEDFATIILTFENGTKANVVISQVSAGRKNHLTFEMDGTKASAKWNQEEPDSLWLGYREKANEQMMRDPSLLNEGSNGYVHYPGGHGEGWADGMKNMMMHFYQAILNNAGVNKESVSFATFHDGHRMMEILEAILESHNKRRWVCIGENKNPFANKFVVEFDTEMEREKFLEWVENGEETEGVKQARELLKEAESDEKNRNEF